IDSKSIDRKVMWVRLPPAALYFMQKNFLFYLTVVILPLIIIALITIVLVVKPTPKEPTQSIPETSTPAES
ncbi:MAG: hypothetical protein Q7R62_02260, partial [bacterium]|nr:hypothetical protein [bacterium]